MPSFTRKAIKETFLKLLDEHPLNEITIKDIVEECGINRNSFYYHFQDLPSLMEEIIKEECDNVINTYSSPKSLVECFDGILEFIYSRKRAIMHIYRSIDRELFESYLMKLSLYFVTAYIDIELENENIDDEYKQIIINYYKCVCFGLIIDWLNNGMKEESVQDLRRILRLKNSIEKEITEKFNE